MKTLFLYPTKYKFNPVEVLKFKLLIISACTFCCNMLEFEPFSMKCTFGNSVDKECNRVDKLLSKRDSNESFRILKYVFIFIMIVLKTSFNKVNILQIFIH